MSPSWLHRNTEDQSDTAKAHHHGNGSCGQAQAQARRPVSIKLKTARVVRCTVGMWCVCRAGPTPRR